MILWRISNHATLDGAGGLFAFGRWHTQGHPILYCTENPATALLETLVHIEVRQVSRFRQFQLLKITAPEHATQRSIGEAALPAHWQESIEQSQQIGDAWLASRGSLMLRVPSVLVPETWNVLINPAHPEAAGLRLERTYTHPIDERLI